MMTEVLRRDCTAPLLNPPACCLALEESMEQSDDDETSVLGNNAIWVGLRRVSGGSVFLTFGILHRQDTLLLLDMDDSTSLFIVQAREKTRKFQAFLFTEFKESISSCELGCHVKSGVI